MADQINPRLLRKECMRRCRLDECLAACCLHGVWIDSAEWQDIHDHADLIIPHMPPDWTDPDLWIDDLTDDDLYSKSGKVVHSRVLPDPTHYGGSACIFLRDDHKCALQVAGDANGLHPWRFKPFYCILHPLDLDEKGYITLDETALLLDEPGSCLRLAEEEIPLIETFEPELRYFLGNEGYLHLVEKTLKPKDREGHEENS